MNRILTTLLLCLIFSSPALAQLYSTQYRTPDQNWMEIESERFRVIYPERYQSEAFRTMKILEAEYEDIQNLVGGELKRFPFILNPENDRSNGFVSPLNFRSEVEIAPIKSKSLNPQSGDWLETVVPHELVHALHFSVNPPSFTRILGLLSPDLRRSVHAAAPLGVLEGIAVQHESHGSIPHSGRGNHPYFTNQFNAVLNTDEEFSMGQLFQVTDFTPPFDRHYIGGYQFTNWLLHTYGDEAMKEAIKFHYRYPFLGFGMALRATTGKWPGTLYDNFSEIKKRNESLRLSNLNQPTDSASKEISFRAECKRLSRPLWLNDETLIFYSRTCNKPTGFYAHHLDSGSTKLLYEVAITEDRDYSLSEDRKHLTYSRYHTDRHYDNLFRGDLHRLNLTDGKSKRLTKNLRLFSPDFSTDDLYALQTDAHEMNLVEVDVTGSEVLKTFDRPEESSIAQVAMRPNHTGEAAILGKRKSVQAIWFQNIAETDSIIHPEPDLVFENSTIFDLHWHPSGEKLLFVSDFSGTLNIYEYSQADNTVTQVTESLYNAFEPSYSPNGENIAYIRQVENEQKLFTLQLDDAIGKEIPINKWTHSEKVQQRLERPLMNRNILVDESEWVPKDYRSGLSWLKPRFWTPTFETQANRDRIGLNFESVNTLSTQAYSFDLNHFADRIWYDLTYINKSFYPGFELSTFNSPQFTPFRGQSNGEEINTLLLQQSVGGSLKMPVRFRLKSNARFTSFLVEPQYFLSNIRFLDPAQTSQSLSEFGTRHTVGLRSVLNLNLRQFTRDLQPNSGWVFFAEGRYGLNSDQIQITTDQFSIEGNLVQRKGVRAGVTTFISPLSRWNQSLRISGQAISQTDLPVFGVASLFSDSFSEIPLQRFNNVGLLNTRYTIPITYPDEGGLLLPAYLSNIYLVIFSQTAADLNRSNFIDESRSVFGAGIRSRFRISNLAFDIGFSIGWEPTRNDYTFRFGSF